MGSLLAADDVEEVVELVQHQDDILDLGVLLRILQPLPRVKLHRLCEKV